MLFHSKIAPETISEGLEFKIFLGGMLPDLLAVALRAPSLNVADPHWPPHFRIAGAGSVISINLKGTNIELGRFRYW